MRNFFRFLFTPDNRGVGTGNLALERSQTIPAYSRYAPGYNVQGGLSTTATPGYAMLNKRLVPVSLLGQGSQLHGQLPTQGLAKQEK